MPDNLKYFIWQENYSGTMILILGTGITLNFISLDRQLQAMQEAAQIQMI